MYTVGESVAADPVYSNLGLEPSYGVVTKVLGPRDVEVRWEGAAKSVSIATRLLRPLKAKEKR